MQATEQQTAKHLASSNSHVGSSNTFVGYVVAILLVLLALFLSRQLRASYESTLHSLFFCAILLAGWRGGLGPAVLASLLSSTAVAFSFPGLMPRFDDSEVEICRFAAFLFAGVFTGWLSAKQKRMEAQLREARDEREKRVNSRTGELAKANRALRESEFRLKKVQRIAKIGYWQRDLVAQRICWPEETAQIFGIPQHEGGISEAELEEFILPDDRKLQREALKCAVENGRPYNLEYRITRPDGEVRVLQVRDELDRDDSGKGVRLFGIVQDITDRRPAESALKENDWFLRVLTKNANDFIRVFDVDGRSVYASPSVERHYGRQPALVFELPHPDDLEKLREWWQRVVAGSTDRLHWRMRDRTGEWGWLESSASLFDSGGKPHGLTVCRDITERKQAEEVLLHIEDELRNVIDSIPVMAWTLQPNGVADFVNRRWVEYFGITLEQYVADPAGPIHPEDVTRVFENWRVQMADGETFDEEMRLRRADGVYRWFLVRIAPAHDKKGNLVKWYGVSADIEDRKRAEQALFETNSRLELILDNAPLAISGWDREGRITSWNKAAERLFGWSAEEVIGQLCRTVPHEHITDYLQAVHKVMQGETSVGLVHYRQKKVVVS